MARPVIITDYDANESAGTITISNVVVPHGAILLVGVGTRDATQATRDVSSVAYNTSEALSLVEELNSDALNLNVEWWRLSNPTAGTHDVVVTLGGDAAQGYAYCAVLRHVSAARPVGTTAEAASADTTDPGVAITPSKNHSLLLSAHWVRGPSSGVSVDHTELVNANPGASNIFATQSYNAKDRTQVTMGLTTPNATDDTVTVAIEVQGARPRGGRDRTRRRA